MRQVKQSSILISLRITHSYDPHIKDFSVVSEAEVDVFLEFPCFIYDPTNFDNLICSSSAFSNSSLYIWNFLVHVLLKTCLKDFAHYLASMWNECSCTVVWTLLIGWMHCTTIFLFGVSMSSSRIEWCINVVLKDSVIPKDTELEIKSNFLADHWTLHWIISEIPSSS